MAIGTLAVFAALALSGCAQPEEAQTEEERPAEAVILTPEDLQWQDAPPSLPPGARLAVLAGDPTAEGPFVMRAQVPPDTLIQPHTHPDVERVTVLSGTAYLGMGEVVNRDNATRLPAGSFFALQPGTVHHFFTEDEAAVIQLQGEGPWGIEYEDTQEA